jgi:hypothetical protein
MFSRKEKTEPTSNRPKFIKAFHAVLFVWFLVFLFGMFGIWAPAIYGLAGNFTATAWFLGVPNAFATLILLFAAEEFMDVE